MATRTTVQNKIGLIVATRTNVQNKIGLIVATLLSLPELFISVLIM